MAARGHHSLRWAETPTLRVALTFRLRVGGGAGRVAAMHSQRATLPRQVVIAAWILRIGLGGWFLASGALKVWGTGLGKFTEQIQNYQIVLPLLGLDFTKGPWDAVAAYAVPWVEIVAGLCLAAGWWRRPVLLLFAGLVAVFAFCVGWAWSRGLDIACGCHGSDAPINYWGKVAEFAGYYAAFAALWWEYRATERSDPRHAAPSADG
ncbi:MAG: DoxX family protein [Akkermansiaceae bacterium]|nr:DoxX family protein [Akkermansiaceae bacterium]